MTSGAALLEPSGIAPWMQVRALLVAFALFGAGCRSVSEPPAAPAAPPLPPLPQFVLQPAWEFAIDEGRDWPLEAQVTDLDLDGFDEVAVVVTPQFEPNGARVWLLSSGEGWSRGGTFHALDFEERKACHLQASVSTLIDVGDTNGDGVTDLAIGVCDGLLYGRFGPTGVWLFSSDTWLPIGHWCRSEDSFGKLVAPVGDVNGDGRSDFAVATDFAPATVDVLSTNCETSLWRTELPIERGFIRDLIATGDADGDGLEELAIQVGSGFSGPSTLFVLAGRDGSVLWSRSGVHSGDWKLLNIASAGDADGDGVPEMWAVLDDPDLDHRRVELLSGRDGSTLRSADRPQHYAGNVNACADLDGDGVGELLVLWWLEGETNDEAIEVISSRTLASLAYLTGDTLGSVAAVRTPSGVKLLSNCPSGLQAFDLVPVEGVGER